MKRLFFYVVFSLMFFYSNAQWQLCTTPETFNGCIDIKGNTIICSNGTNKLYYSNNYGLNWTVCTTLPYSAQQIFEIKNNGATIYVTTDVGLFKSADNGLSWTRIRINGENHIALKGSYIFVSDYIGFNYASNDNGATWTDVTNNNMLVNKYVLFVYGNYLYNGGYANICSVYKTANNGTSWSCSGSGMQSGCDIQCMTAYNKYFFAGSVSRGIYFSSDTGSNWIQANTGMTDSYIECLANYGTNIFAGTYSSGFYRTNNNGSNWILSNEGLTNLHIISIAVCGSYIYLTTNGGGLWRRPLNEVGIKEADLMENKLSIYPNPVIDELILETKSDSFLKYEVINLLGDIILSTSIESKDTRINTKEWQKGIYFIKVYTSDTFYLKKLVKD